VGVCLGAVALAVALLIVMFGGALLNSYGKGKIERVFAKAHPGYALRIGELDYSVGADRLVAQTVRRGSTNTTLKIGRISLTGVRWAQLLWGTATLADVLAKASLENLRLRAAGRTATASTTKMNHRTGPSRRKNRSVHPGLGLAWLRVRTAIELVIGSMNDGCEKNSNNRQSCHPARQGVSDNEQFSRSRL
jgi:hypothetical protein